MGAKGWDIPVSNMVHAHRKTEDTATVAVKKRKTTESTGSVGEGHNHASHATQATRNKEKVPERERETRKDQTTNPERTRDAATSESRPVAVFRHLYPACYWEVDRHRHRLLPVVPPSWLPPACFFPAWLTPSRCRS